MPHKRPNIILILADDMGYSDIGCFGGDIETPHLDSLAEKGIKYSNFYNSARCCPARAALLTGLYPHQAGMGWMTAADLGFDGYAGELNSKSLTIAECLHPTGYSTYMCGKWHLTFVKNTAAEGDKSSWPCQRGFDRFYGTTAGGGSYWRTPTLTSGNRHIDPGDDFYYTDAISEHACSFINDHAGEKKENPFFMYVAYTAPHWPLHAHKKDIEHYRGKFLRGWDAMRSDKFKRIQDLGLLHYDWKLSPRDPEVPAWDDLTEEQKDEYDLRMSIYAAQVTAMDRGIGAIAETLKSNGQLDNTLIIFLSDNGGCHEEIHRANSDPALFGTDESYESYGRPWANYSNIPFREFKSWVHEGGISTPLIAHWPGGITCPGTVTDQRGHITDLMPTFLELAGVEHPSETDTTHHLHKLAGESLAENFKGNYVDRKVIFWEHEGNRALRHGRWKIVCKGLAGQWELYDMEKDRTEQNNLFTQEPDIVKVMVDQWHKIAIDTEVFPLDGRGWGERCQSSVR